MASLSKGNVKTDVGCSHLLCLCDPGFAVGVFDLVPKQGCCMTISQVQLAVWLHFT